MRDHEANIAETLALFNGVGTVASTKLLVGDCIIQITRPVAEINISYQRSTYIQSIPSLRTTSKISS
jgi:hypothetical protein